MAYMNAEKKKVIAQKLKEVMPKNWKYSLSVNNHSTIVLTISAAPVDLRAANGGRNSFNHYNLKSIEDSELKNIFTDIVAAMNCLNYDNSDIYSDYHDVGYYLDINIGRWDKPFIETEVAQLVSA